MAGWCQLPSASQTRLTGSLLRPAKKDRKPRIDAPTNCDDLQPQWEQSQGAEQIIIGDKFVPFPGQPGRCADPAGHLDCCPISGVISQSSVRNAVCWNLWLLRSILALTNSF